MMIIMNKKKTPTYVSLANDSRSGAGTGFEKAGGSFRFKHNGRFSPKHYQSGWKGGSRARIKTTQSVKLGGTVSKLDTSVGLACTGYNLYGAYEADGNKWGKNCKKTACSEVGSWTGGFVGATTGAAIGSSFCPGLGTVLGGVIGGIGGSYGGGKGGEAYGERRYG